MRIRALLSIGLALCTLGSSCGIATPDLDNDTGTVQFVGTGSGCWVIETDHETYEPLNLPEELKVDGLDVAFDAEVREDRATACQVGIPIELLRIEAI
jgi:hypothetical protein